MTTMLDRVTAVSEDFVTGFRKDLDHGRGQFAGAVLRDLLRLLANNTSAAVAWADPRSVAELLEDAADGDRSAEGPLYVRSAAELDKVAARAVGSSAFDRDDMHQEGAFRFITDARNGKIRADFGGNIGAYLHKAVFAHLLNIACTQSPGKPTDPTRLTQKLRQALRHTADADGEYDLIGAAAYARDRFGWTLATFWDVHRTMFAGTEDLYVPDGDGRTLAEALADPSAEDALERVEVIETVRAMLAANILARREREVINLLFGMDGPALSEDEAAVLLGVTRQSINKTKLRALAKLGAVINN